VGRGGGSVLENFKTQKVGNIVQAAGLCYLLLLETIAVLLKYVLL